MSEAFRPNAAPAAPSMSRAVRRAGRIACAAVAAVLGTAAAAFAQFTVIHQFIPIPVTVPLFPNALVEGTDGNFYGTSQAGGDHGVGSVFRMTPGGSVTVLYSFTAMTDGGFSMSPLIQARDGNFYGTTVGEGGAADGTVFRITPAGSFTTLHVFVHSDGSAPWTGLVEGLDGFLYGATQSGGDHDRGVLFRISTAGDFAVLHSFDGAVEGGAPRGELIQGFDGNFYGTTASGGTGSQGTVFRMTPGGDVTVIHTFIADPSDGAEPLAALVQAVDGNFYGTTQAGGLANLGTVFRLTPGGTFTVLHSFSGGDDGWHPSAPLLVSSDMKLYGTTQFGPMAPAFNGLGTIFSMTLGGTLTTLHQFDGSDATNPVSGLIHARDGNFYGTVQSGGPTFGIAYRLNNTAACDDSLRASFSGGTLSLGFTLQTAAPGTWTTFVVTPTSAATLWSLAVPVVTPAASFTVPIAHVPNIGRIFVVTVLSAPGAVCADVKAVNTGP